MTFITRRFVLCLCMSTSMFASVSYASEIVHVLDFPNGKDAKTQTSTDILVKNVQPISK